MSFLGSQASLTSAMTAESQQALEVQSHALREGGGTWSQSSTHFLWPTPRTVVSLEALADGYSPDGHLGTPIHTSPGKPLGPQLLRQRRVLCPGCRLSTLRGPAPACLGLGGRARATPAECQGAHWSASETRHRHLHVQVASGVAPMARLRARALEWAGLGEGGSREIVAWSQS